MNHPKNTLCYILYQHIVLPLLRQEKKAVFLLKIKAHNERR